MPDKFSHFISFVEEGTDVEHDEGQLSGYWSQTGMMDVTCIFTKGWCNGSSNFHNLEAFG